MTEPISDYLARLSANLWLRSKRKAEVIEELRGHLEQLDAESAFTDVGDIVARFSAIETLAARINRSSLNPAGVIAAVLALAVCAFWIPLMTMSALVMDPSIASYVISLLVIVGVLSPFIVARAMALRRMSRASIVTACMAPAVASSGWLAWVFVCEMSRHPLTSLAAVPAENLIFPVVSLVVMPGALGLICAATVFASYRRLAGQNVA
jgi:hypothetical protein